MSLWTPGGEHEVPRERPGDGAPPGAPAAGPEGPGGEPGGDALADLSPEERAQAEAMVDEMNEVRRQLAEAPAPVVVANHAMGLYELAAIHLSQQPPHLLEARLAIDAFGALVELLKGRLGPDEVTLTDALTQIRLAFVQLSGGSDTGSDAGQAAAGEGAG